MNLMRHGYPNRIAYTQLLPKFDKLLPEWMKVNNQTFMEHLLLASSCNMIDFKLGKNYIFLRPGRSILLEPIVKSDVYFIKDIASKIEEQFKRELWQSVVNQVTEREPVAHKVLYTHCQSNMPIYFDQHNSDITINNYVHEESGYIATETVADPIQLDGFDEPQTEEEEQQIFYIQLPRSDELSCPDPIDLSINNYVNPLEFIELQPENEQRSHFHFKIEEQDIHQSPIVQNNLRCMFI